MATKKTKTKKNKQYATLPIIKASNENIVIYQRAILALVKQMRKSVDYYCISAYKPTLEIMDAKPVKPISAVKKLQQVINEIRRRYAKKFNILAGELPQKLIDKINKETSKRINKSLKDSIKEIMPEIEIDITKMSASMKMALRASVNENINLIKSIPSEYFKRIEYDLMSSISKGRKMSEVVQLLDKGYGITKRRAVMIAYDQVNKITAQVDRHRKMELGLNYAIWRHSNIPQHPRHSHQLANGKEFDIRKGCLIDGEYIQPAELINCSCYAQAIVKFDN